MDVVHGRTAGVDVRCTVALLCMSWWQWWRLLPVASQITLLWLGPSDAAIVPEPYSSCPRKRGTSYFPPAS